MENDEQRADWREYHDRIVTGDPTAFLELCEIAIPVLLGAMRRRFAAEPRDFLESFIFDSLLKYQREPHKFDPTQRSLYGYLYMDIHGDVLNGLDKHNREAKRLLSLDDESVELQLASRNESQDEDTEDDWLQEYTTLSRDDLLMQLKRELTVEERHLVIAMAEGERKTSVFAGLLGLERLSPQEQATAVKRAKDRIKKKLERFGKRRRSS